MASFILGTRQRKVVASTLRLPYSRQRTPIPIEQETTCSPELLGLDISGKRNILFIICANKCIYIYIYIYILQTLPHVSVLLHHLHGVLIV